MSKRQRPHQGWIASLSNGETVFEKENPPGEPTAWRALLLRLEKTPGLKITQLRLQRAGKEAVSESHAEGYFQAYESRMNLHGKKQGTSQGIGFVKGEKVYIMWMNMQGQVRPQVRDLGDVLVHTTIARINELV